MAITSWTVLSGILFATYGAAIPQPPHVPQPSAPNLPSTPSPPPSISAGKGERAVSAWQDTICQQNPALPVNASATRGCYNYGADATDVKINWGADDTYATFFNLHDCHNPVNVTTQRKRGNDDKPPTECAQVATGDGGSGQPNMKGWPGSVLIGQGNVPKNEPYGIYGGIPSPDDVNAMTGFFGYEGCSGDQKKKIEQAANDLLKLAYAAVPYNAKPDEVIDWNSAAALEFFGPPTRNEAHRKRVIASFQNAGWAYSRWGDRWYDRYIILKCSTALSPVASTDNDQDKKYSIITFYTPFFNLPTHAQALRGMNDHRYLRDHVYSLESQASCFFHELLHVRRGEASVCEHCDDRQIEVGPYKNKKIVTVYGPGASKLLAQNSAYEAATNNDNLLGYAMAMFIQNQFSNYPAYPRAWDPTKYPEDQRSSDLYKEVVKARGKPQTVTQPNNLGNGTYPDSEYPNSYLSFIKGLPPAAPTS